MNKKLVLLVFVIGICFGSLDVFALSQNENIFNNNNISISKSEYHNLLNLGFTDNEIMNMDLMEFNNNKNLKGKILSQNIVYYDDNNKIINNSSNLYSPMGTQPGYVEIAIRKMTTTIVSVNGRFRYKVSVEWKQIPSVRSYDIIGIGMDSTVKIGSSLYFQENFCYSNNNCDYTGVHTQKITSSGATAMFKVPSASIVSLNAYLYYEVDKNTASTINKLTAYGDYSHATKNIGETSAKNHSINRGGIQLDSSISSYYDTVDTANAIWTGSW